MPSLFYSEEDIYWVYDTFGAERLAQDLHNGVFCAEHIANVCQNGDPEEQNLFAIVLPHADLNTLPKWVERLNTPKYLELREHLLEVAPISKEVLGASLKTNPLAWLLASNFSMKPEEFEAMVNSNDPNLAVLTDPNVLHGALQNLNNPKGYGIIVWNAIKGMWASPAHLKIALQYAPQEFIDNNIQQLLEAARMASSSDAPTGCFTAEQMVDELLPFVSQKMIEEWKQQNTVDTQEKQSPIFGEIYEALVPKGRYHHLIEMIEARTATPQKAFENNLSHIFDGSGWIAEVHYSFAQLRDMERTQTLSQICSDMETLFELSQSDVRAKIEGGEYSSDEINAIVYVALQKSHPILAKTALDYVDWTNQFAKESLRLALGKTSSNSKQAIVQQMIVKREAQDLKGRLSAEIAHTVERDTDAPTRRM